MFDAVQQLDMALPRIVGLGLPKLPTAVPESPEPLSQSPARVPHEESHPCLPLRLVTSDQGVYSSVNLNHLYGRIPALLGGGTPLLAQLHSHWRALSALLKRTASALSGLTGVHRCHASSLSMAPPTQTSHRAWPTAMQKRPHGLPA